MIHLAHLWILLIMIRFSFWINSPTTHIRHWIHYDKLVLQGVLNNSRFRRSKYCLLPEGVIASLTAARFLTCAAECSLSSACQAFGYNDSSSTCRLSSGVDVHSAESTCSVEEDVFWSGGLYSNSQRPYRLCFHYLYFIYTYLFICLLYIFIIHICWWIKLKKSIIG